MEPFRILGNLYYVGASDVTVFAYAYAGRDIVIVRPEDLSFAPELPTSPSRCTTFPTISPSRYKPKALPSV